MHLGLIWVKKGSSSDNSSVYEYTTGKSRRTPMIVYHDG